MSSTDRPSSRKNCWKTKPSRRACRPDSCVSDMAEVSCPATRTTPRVGRSSERTLLQVAIDDPRTTTAAWRSTAREVLASSDEQARLIEALLTLASSESGLNDNEPVDLAPAVSATLADLRPDADRLGIHLDELTEPAPLDGDPLLIERLVANLLTNAVRHNGPAGGGVLLRLVHDNLFEYDVQRRVPGTAGPGTSSASRRPPRSMGCWMRSSPGSTRRSRTCTAAWSSITSC